MCNPKGEKKKGISKPAAIGILEKSRQCDLQFRVTVGQKKLHPTVPLKIDSHVHACFFLTPFHVCWVLRSGTEGHRRSVAPLASISKIYILTCARCFWLKPALSNYSEPTGRPLHVRARTLAGALSPLHTTNRRVSIFQSDTCALVSGTLPPAAASAGGVGGCFSSSLLSFQPNPAVLSCCNSSEPGGLGETGARPRRVFTDRSIWTGECHPGGVLLGVRDAAKDQSTTLFFSPSVYT